MFGICFRLFSGGRFCPRSLSWPSPTNSSGYGRTALEVLEGHLRNHEWLALGRATIADIACYPYVRRAPEGGIPLEPYPAVNAWLGRCETLPGWLKLD
jgi:glutathione S-transferase